MDFLHRFVGDLGAALAAGNVVIGNRLGLFRGPGRPDRPRPASWRSGRAPTRGTSPSGCAARPSGGYVTRAESRRRGDLRDDRGAGPSAWPTRTTRSSLRAGSCSRSARCKGGSGSPRPSAPATGFGWHEHDDDMLVGCDGSSAPATTRTWSPLAPGARRGGGQAQGRGAVADVGFGPRRVDIVMAQAFPTLSFVGADYHEGSIERRGPHAERGAGRHGEQNPLRRHGRRPRPRLQPGRRRLRPRDDVRAAFTTWATRVGAARRIRGALARSGRRIHARRAARRATHVEDNLNPLGRVFYGALGLICTPGLARAARSGEAIGTQAGPDAHITAVLHRGRVPPFVPHRGRDPRQPRSTRPVRSRSRSGPGRPESAGARDRSGAGSAMRAWNRESGAVERDGVPRRLRGVRRRRADGRLRCRSTGRSSQSRGLEGAGALPARRRFRVDHLRRPRATARSDRPADAGGVRRPHDVAADALAVLDAHGRRARRAGRAVVRGGLDALHAGRRPPRARGRAWSRSRPSAAGS